MKESISTFFTEVFDLTKAQSNAAEIQAREQCKNGNASMVAAISALYAIWKFFQHLPAASPASAVVAAPTNLAVANHISWLCNSALSIRKLALTGFEPQARVLTRSFIEAIYQTLVIFYDHESYLAYKKGVDANSAKDAYYAVFAKKKNLHKKLQKLEDSFVRQTPAEREEQYIQRVGMLEHYSQATHSSAMHILTSALQPNDESILAPTILGKYSVSTDNTLLNCSHEICYFCMLLEHIMEKVWFVDELNSNENYKMFSQIFKVAAAFRTHKLKLTDANNEEKQSLHHSI